MIKAIAELRNREKSGIIVQFLSFAFVGCMGTGVQYGLLGLLVVYLAVYPVAASAIGFVCGAVVNYILSYKFVFHADGDHYRTLAKFATIASIGLGINSLVMAGLMSILGLNTLFAQIGATGMVLIWNFFGNRQWTFRRKDG
ncbi:MAG: GtrA family protein [Acidobacteriota bacterium]